MIAQLIVLFKHYLPHFFITLLSIETIILLIQFKIYYTHETLINFITGGLSYILQLLIKGSFITNLYPAVYRKGIFPLGDSIYAWLLGIAIYLILQYYIHYLGHKVRFFWCMHEVHHSATTMDISAGLRTSIFDIVGLEISYLIIPALGIDPIIYFTMYLIHRFWGSFIHVSEKIIHHIPLLHWIMVTPEIHHIHHARNSIYLDKNFGELIPWMDMLAGTFQLASPTENIEFGTTKIKEPISFWKSQTHEWKALFADVAQEKNFSKKLKIIFGSPK